MIDLAAARQQLAAAASTSAVPCLPYPPDNPAPPIAFVDSLHLDYAAPVSFTIPATCTAVIVACGQRYDQAASMSMLEGDIADVVEALEQLPGLTVDSVTSGPKDIGKTTLPAVSYTVAFPIPTPSA